MVRQSDSNSNTVYILGINKFWVLLRAHFKVGLHASICRPDSVGAEIVCLAKMSQSLAQNMFIPVNINSIVLFSCEVQKVRTWIFLQSYQSISLSLSTHSSLTGREPVCERHTWTAVVGTGLVVEFFQPLQLAGVVLGYC